MKNTSRRIITSVLTLVLTVIALGTTTFAWFSLSTVSNVSNISGDITAGDGLEIRLVGVDKDDKEVATSWKSNLSSDDVVAFITGTEADKGIFYGQSFAPVTTSDMSDFYTQGNTNNGNIHLTDTAGKNEDYLEFEIEFRSQETGEVILTELDISGNESLDNFVVDGDEYLQFPGQTNGKGNLDVQTSAAFGARVSFSIGDTPTHKVFQYDNTKSEITEDNGKVSGNTFMGTNPVEHGQWDYLRTSKGLKFFTDKVEGDGAEITEFTDISIYQAFGNKDENALKDVKLTLVGTEGSYKGSITVRIWIEGWDADSYDSIYEAILSVSMIFKKNTPAP